MLAIFNALKAVVITAVILEIHKYSMVELRTAIHGVAKPGI